jgi:hypothetical protein
VPDLPTTPFAPCPTCGVLVTVRLWTHPQGQAPAWRELEQPTSTTLGIEHLCGEEDA